MEKRYNSEAFTPDQIEKGLHIDLLNFLMKLNANSDDYYADIHIWTDGYCTVVDWIENIDGVGFKFVDYDEVVMKEIRLPDTTVVYDFPENEETIRKDWENEHKNEIEIGDENNVQ